MSLDNIEQKTNKNPSNELIQLIDSMVVQYRITTERRDRQVREIIDKGRSEGLEDKQISDLIKTALKKHGLSDRTISNALPDELKDKKMQAVRAYRQEQKVSSDDSVSTSIDESSDTETDKPVYREPDLVAPTGRDRPVVSDVSITNDYHTMNVPDKSQIPSTEWMIHNQPTDYTVKARLNMRDNKKNMDFYVMLTVNCYPDKKTVEIEPIDKMAIQYIRPDQ